ncbi:hypothetical protein GCT13_41215 [Paraburkholderia sp. CNPSo 3157]|uniref:Uncharacterized protein n=1 Tax=Paraburkholderia franconis TaxID=2654983 RepID=A0A7X1NJX1_9BURK|nr:hypothetical protein [Paraburkholderia franconis]MPW23031.1 hypothetical protein [Paraburkholderia franconis]
MLKAFSTLDALHRGKGNRGVFAVLGQQLIVSERLCLAGYQQDELDTVRHAHAAMVRVDWDARDTGQWKIADTDYEAVRAALAVYEHQLTVVPRPLVVKALLESARNIAVRRTPEA